MPKPWVYIASPYTKGDPGINTQCQLKAFHEMMNDGVVWPYAPLWSHFQHCAYPRHYQDWIDYDLAIIDRLDACLRINARYPQLSYYISESKGADGEVAYFKSQGKPVFYCKTDLYEWARERESERFIRHEEGQVEPCASSPVIACGPCDEGVANV